MNLDYGPDRAEAEALDRVVLDGSIRGCRWGRDATAHPATGWAANAGGVFWPSCEKHGMPGTYQPGPVPRPAPKPIEYVDVHPWDSPEHGALVDDVASAMVGDRTWDRMDSEDLVAWSVTARLGLDRAAARVEEMCDWVQGFAGARAAHPTHSGFHFGYVPGQSGVCPYYAIAAVLRGQPDPRRER